MPASTDSNAESCCVWLSSDDECGAQELPVAQPEQSPNVLDSLSAGDIDQACGDAQDEDKAAEDQPKVVSTAHTRDQPRRKADPFAHFTPEGHRRIKEHLRKRCKEFGLACF